MEENKGWFQILKNEVKRHSQADVVKKTGLSKTTISQVINGKYPANTDNIAATIIRNYGHKQTVMCPVLEELAMEQCIAYWEAAMKVGVRCGNPATMRLYNSCRSCKLLL